MYPLRSLSRLQGEAYLPQAKRQLFVVGIGASAGGIEAFEGLFHYLPPDTGAAFVIVAHLAPNKVSMLDEIVGRFTAMPVAQARDGIKIESDHVYIIPPDGALTLEHGKLRVHALVAPQRAPNPIDLSSTASPQDQGEQAIGIVLSGGGSDGTLGIRAIKEAGGLTLAQGTDHSAPRHASMPRERHRDRPRRPVAAGRGHAGASSSTTPPASRAAGALTAAPGEPRSAAEARDARSATSCAPQVGHDFGGYKEKTFLRRVQRRMQVLQLADLDAYVEHLRQDPDEVDAALPRSADRRDPLLPRPRGLRRRSRREVIPRLFDGKGADDTVRVWVPGCATGEEVYSIAILLREHMDALRRRRRRCRSSAPTSTSRRSTSPAPAATRRALLDGVSPERPPALLHRGRRHATASTKEVRDLCVFSSHSIVRDPPFSRLDLISCRNLLIYLDAGPAGPRSSRCSTTRCGRAASCSSAARRMCRSTPICSQPLDKKHRLFQRRDHAGTLPELPLLLSRRRDAVRPRGPPRAAASPAGRARPAPLGRDPRARAVRAGRMWWSTGDGDVVHYSPRTGHYLEAPAGPAEPAARGAWRARGCGSTCAPRCRRPPRRGAAVRREGVQRRDRGGACSRSTSRSSRCPTGTPIRLFLVLFADLGAAADGRGQRHALARRSRATAPPSSSSPSCGDTRERLQSTDRGVRDRARGAEGGQRGAGLDQRGAAVDQRGAGDQQGGAAVGQRGAAAPSTQELNAKVDQLTRPMATCSNLFDSTQIAVVFLDRQLRIRSFTPAVTAAVQPDPDRRRPAADRHRHQSCLRRAGRRPAPCPRHRASRWSDASARATAGCTI